VLDASSARHFDATSEPNCGCGGQCRLGGRSGGQLAAELSVAVNATNIPAASGSALALANVQVANAGTYDVVVTNLYGATNSCSRHPNGAEPSANHDPAAGPECSSRVKRHLLRDRKLAAAR